jgi:Fe-Mn family superoxide dismutase
MFTPKDFSHLIGLDGFSDDLLRNHFTLYEGYVANVNKLAELSAATEIGTVQYSELKRRFGWEWNGVRLHELYFGNLTKNALPISETSPLAKMIADRFGSLAAWEKDFRATGAMRGIGWVILAHDASEGRLFNIWVNEHDEGHLAGCAPILVMDVFEHAFILDYGLKRADYIESFFRSIDWEEAGKRLVA